jgi:betaine-aldehyde dehydrogenase
VLPEYRNFIAGRYAVPLSETVATVPDPATGRPAFTAAVSRAGDVDVAVRSAAAAFDRWRWSSPAERSGALLALADAVAADGDELIAAESAMTGKAPGPLRADELEPVVDHLRFFAGAARVPEGRAAAEYLAGHTSLIRREPLGVCAQITPWNFPLMTAVWKLAPALAAGNTVVLKPAPTTPITTLRLAELAAAVLGPGAVNVVCGDRETGRLLAVHPLPALVSFTGSTEGGREVAAAAGRNLTRTQLELGGNAAAVVLHDADIADAVAQIAVSAFGNAGQDCVAAARVLVDVSRHDELLDALAARANGLRVGPPDSGADLGPLHGAGQLDRLLELVRELPPHAKVVAGGQRVGADGHFGAPTVVAGARQDDDIVQRETFGPVVTVQPFAGPDEALALANGVPQGLACSVWTSDHATAMDFARRLEFGCIWINTHLRFASEMPHGGYKASGYGKDLSLYAMDDYTQIKHVMTDLGASPLSPVPRTGAT